MKLIIRFIAFSLLFSCIGAHALTLRGAVRDTNDRPIANARIEVVGYSIVELTDTEGRFTIDLENGVDEIHVEASGFNHKVLHLHGNHEQLLVINLTPTVMEQIDVVGLPLHRSTMESAQPIAVLGGEELRQKQAPTLGETLKNEISVHSTYFGPVASSPIIRGLDGPRVMVAQNGLDVGDASRVGPDHAVATDVVTAQQVEILRGPSTLFYGSGAIGGVINVIDNRIPSDSESSAAFAMQHNTVAGENEIAGSLTGGGDYLRFHVDGFWRESDDYKIPGFAVLESEEEHEDEGHDEHKKGILENSAADSDGFNIGGSVLLESGYVGVSYGKLNRTYGVIGHSHGHEEEEGDEEIEDHHDADIYADMEQDRWQLIGQWQADGDFISEINTRIGYTDYEHAEIEDGVPETVFKNRTTQWRTDLLHQELLGWRGAFSLEWKASDFEAQGEEAFTAPSETTELSLAWMEEKHIGAVLWQLGARIEEVEITADPAPLAFHHHEEDEAGAQELFAFDDFRFAPVSLSVGLVWDFVDGYNIGFALTHAERAPSASELFSAGPHMATQSYELGALFEIHQEGDEYHIDYSGEADIETSNNIDISLRKFEGNFGFVLNAFYNEVEDYYFQANTGLLSGDLEEADSAEEEEHEHADDLPVYITQQANARFYGLEAEFVWQLSPSIKMTIWGDSIRAELEDGGFLPRIPPLRAGTEFTYQGSSVWDATLSAVHYFKQEDIAENETPTAAYDMIDLYFSYYLNSRNAEWVLFAKANNLTNEEARVHSSFLKDQAPLPARGVTLGVRALF